MDVSLGKWWDETAGRTSTCAGVAATRATVFEGPTRGWPPDWAQRGHVKENVPLKRRCTLEGMYTNDRREKLSATSTPLPSDAPPPPVHRHDLETACVCQKTSGRGKQLADTIPKSFPLT